jgi:choline dehydrogenase
MSATSLPTEAGIVVVGGGPGGAACAAVLAELATDSVVLLEAGPDYGLRRAGRWPADVLDAASIPLSHDWGLRDINGAGVDLPRAKVLGGCSSHNGCTASLGARADYDDWAARGNPGWESNSVEPLLNWVHERFRVRRYEMTELTPPQAAFVDAGLHAGLPFADDLDDLDAGVGIGPMPVNIVAGVRWNAAFAFLDPIRDRPNLKIVAGVQARRILFRRGAVVGVEVDAADGLHVIHTDCVIAACCTYHSPALLMRSGIGPANDLAAIDVDVVADLPGVGGNLLDHPCVRLDFYGRDGLLDEMASTPWHPDEQAVGRARSALCDAGPYDIHVFMVAGANTGHHGLPAISLYGGAMRAVSTGRVTLDGRGPLTIPRIDHRFGTDVTGHDRAVLAEARQLLREMSATPALAAVLGRPAGTTDAMSKTVSYCHPAGSCRLGPGSDRLAVVGNDGAVHGVTGLHIADASIMPNIIRGNPNLPVAMVGARIASALLGLGPADVASVLTASSQLRTAPI